MRRSDIFKERSTPVPLIRLCSWQLILAVGTLGKRNECFIMYWRGEEMQAKIWLRNCGWWGVERKWGGEETTNYEFRWLALFFKDDSGWWELRLLPSLAKPTQNSLLLDWEGSTYSLTMLLVLPMPWPLIRFKYISLFHRAFWFIKFYSHQLMHFFIQLCISLLSYIKIT